MKFEYDKNKSLINKRKHGLDFEEAQVLWTDSEAVNIQAKNDSDNNDSDFQDNDYDTSDDDNYVTDEVDNDLDNQKDDDVDHEINDNDEVAPAEVKNSIRISSGSKTATSQGYKHKISIGGQFMGKAKSKNYKINLGKKVVK